MVDLAPVPTYQYRSIASRELIETKSTGREAWLACEPSTGPCAT